MDFVVGYCESWDTALRTSKHHYTERLARDGHRVLYLENPYTPVTALRYGRQFRRQMGDILCSTPEEVCGNIWRLVSVAPLPYHGGHGGIWEADWLNEINQRSVGRRIARAIRWLGFESPVLIAYLPHVLPLINGIPFRRVVVHLVDEWSGLRRAPRGYERLLSALVQRADVCVAVSQPLYDRYKPLARSISLLRHGTDQALFSRVLDGCVAPDPRTVTLTGKRIGYYGALHKLNWPLITAVARMRPDWSFIFIGPISGPQAWRTPFTLPRNVNVWDSRPRQKLPEFLSAIDLFWMPFEDNLVTRNMSPIKLYEVMSAGVPVLSQDLAECRAIAGHHALYASTAEEFSIRAQMALESDTLVARRRRAEAAYGADWEDRYQIMRDMLVAGEAP